MADAVSDVKKVELRGECPEHIVDVVDAYSLATNRTRMQMVVQILGEWARQRRHETTIAARVLRINPAEPDR